MEGPALNKPDPASEGLLQLFYSKERWRGLLVGGTASVTSPTPYPDRDANQTMKAGEPQELVRVAHLGDRETSRRTSLRQVVVIDGPRIRRPGPLMLPEVARPIPPQRVLQ